MNLDWCRLEPCRIRGSSGSLKLFCRYPIRNVYYKIFLLFMAMPILMRIYYDFGFKEEKNKCECMWKLSSLLNRAHAFLLLSPLNAEEVWWFQGIRKNRSISVYTPMNASCTMLPLKLLALSTSNWSPLTTLFFTPG